MTNFYDQNLMSLKAVIFILGEFSLKKTYLQIGTTAILALLLLSGCSNQSHKTTTSRDKAESSSLAKESSTDTDLMEDDDSLDDNKADESSVDAYGNDYSENTATKSQASSFSMSDVKIPSIQLSGGSSVTVPKVQPNKSSSTSSIANVINSPDQAIAAVKAKYGDQNGKIHWNCMIDGTTGKAINDGYYFVKGTANDGTMTGTQYSLRVYPDGTIKEN